MFIYKIMSQQTWQQSQQQACLLPLPLDIESGFIHMCTEQQIEPILAKFWAQERDVVLLKLDANKLIGDLRYESNPGGSNKYYHLYNGSIPLAAVVSSQPAVLPL